MLLFRRASLLHYTGSHHFFLLSYLDHATGIDNALNVPLYSLKAHVLTALALQMIEDSSKGGELPTAAPAVGAVVEVLLVGGRAEVLVQGCQPAEEAVAEIALVGVDEVGPCHLGGLVAAGA